MALFSSLVYVSKSSPARLPGPQKLTNGSPSSAQVRQWEAKISGSPLSLNVSKSNFRKQHESKRNHQFYWNRPVHHLSSICSMCQKEINSLIGVWRSLLRPHRATAVQKKSILSSLKIEISIYFPFWDNHKQIQCFQCWAGISKRPSWWAKTRIILVLGKKVLENAGKRLGL